MHRAKFTALRALNDAYIAAQEKSTAKSYWMRDLERADRVIRIMPDEWFESAEAQAEYSKEETS